MKCGRHVPGHNSEKCQLAPRHDGDCTDYPPPTVVGCSCGGDRETGYEHNQNCKGFWPPAYIELRRKLSSAPDLSTCVLQHRIAALETEVAALRRAREISDEHLREVAAYGGGHDIGQLLAAWRRVQHFVDTAISRTPGA